MIAVSAAVTEKRKARIFASTVIPGAPAPAAESAFASSRRSDRLGIATIADAAQSLHVGRAIGARPQFLAEIPNVNVQGARLARGLGETEFVDEDRSLEGLARVFSEEGEKRELGGREGDPFAAASQFVPGLVDGEIGYPQDFRGRDPVDGRVRGQGRGG